VSWFQKVRSEFVFLKNSITLLSTNCSKRGLTVFVYPSISSTHHMTTYAVHTHTHTNKYNRNLCSHYTSTVTITRRSCTTALSDALAGHRLIERPLTTASRSQLVVRQRMRYRPSPPQRSCRERRNYCPSNQFKKSVFILLLLPLYVFHVPTGFFY